MMSRSPRYAPMCARVGATAQARSMQPRLRNNIEVSMSKVRVSASISIDGFGAGPQQSLENPQGVGGLALGEWVFATRTFQCMHGKDWTVQDIHRKGEG